MSAGNSAGATGGGLFFSEACVAAPAGPAVDRDGQGVGTAAKLWQPLQCLERLSKKQAHNRPTKTRRGRERIRDLYANSGACLPQASTLASTGMVCYVQVKGPASRSQGARCYYAAARTPGGKKKEKTETQGSIMQTPSESCSLAMQEEAKRCFRGTSSPGASGTRVVARTSEYIQSGRSTDSGSERKWGDTAARATRRLHVSESGRTTTAEGRHCV